MKPLSINPEIGLAANGDISLRFSSANSLGHSVSIPCDEKGLRIIKLILVARDRGEIRLGESGNPTQSMVLEWLKNDQFQREQAKREIEKLANEAVLAEF